MICMHLSCSQSTHKYTLGYVCSSNTFWMLKNISIKQFFLRSNSFNVYFTWFSLNNTMLVSMISDKHTNSLLSDKDYLRTMTNKIDEVKKQYAFPVYNIDQINNVPDDEI